MADQIPLDSASLPVRSDPYDVLLWPDDTWCYRFERKDGHMDWMSDDYRVIPYFNAEWLEVTNQMPF
jgi:hypothetical protein